ncbi:VOC family protein [Castellaniella sp.]|uniref:VOC family protein n=1 Tax=Castellaniella sp. TaxID=1955812 RepID=UPI0035618D85
MSLQMCAPLEVGLNVYDLAKMRAFYETQLGLQFINEVRVAPAKAQHAALSRTGYVVVRLQTQRGERLKLLAAETPVAPRATQPAFILDAPNSAYLTFIIKDLRAACARLQAYGSEFLTGAEPIEVRPGTWLAFLRDPEGNVVELVQYDDLAAYRSDLATAPVGHK